MLSRLIRIAIGRRAGVWLGNWIVRGGLRLIATPEDEARGLEHASRLTEQLIGARILTIRHHNKSLPGWPPSQCIWISTDRGCLELGSPIMEFRCDLEQSAYPEEVSRANGARN